MSKVALALVLAALAGCAIKPTGPAGQLSSTNVNPITGSRGGTSSGS